MDAAQNQMTILIAFNIALGLAAFFGGYVLKSIMSRLDKVETADNAMSAAVNDLRVALPTNYVSKPEHTSALDAIHSAIREMARNQTEAFLRIETKLDGKADK